VPLWISKFTKACKNCRFLLVVVLLQLKEVTPGTLERTTCSSKLARLVVEVYPETQQRQKSIEQSKRSRELGRRLYQMRQWRRSLLQAKLVARSSQSAALDLKTVQELERRPRKLLKTIVDQVNH
jgi:hypothetical protein